MAGSSTTVIVLLRGVNVGGKNKLRMTELRAAAESVGYVDPATYLQSGNLIVRGVATSKVGRVAGEIHDAIKAAAGLDVPVITRTAEEWRAIIEANPFPDAVAEGTTLHLVVLDGKAATGVRDFDAARFDPEALAVSEREVYLSLPGGLGRSKLAAAVMRLDNARSGTARNWTTALALAEMAAE